MQIKHVPACTIKINHYIILQNGEAYLTTLERETQEKTLLLGRSVKFLKSLGRLDASEVARVPKPDPVRLFSMYSALGCMGYSAIIKVLLFYFIDSYLLTARSCQCR